MTTPQPLLVRLCEPMFNLLSLVAGKYLRQHPPADPAQADHRLPETRLAYITDALRLFVLIDRHWEPGADPMALLSSVVPGHTLQLPDRNAPKIPSRHKLHRLHLPIDANLRQQLQHWDQQPSDGRKVSDNHKVELGLTVLFSLLGFELKPEAVGTHQDLWHYWQQAVDTDPALSSLQRGDYSRISDHALPYEQIQFILAGDLMAWADQSDGATGLSF